MDGTQSLQVALPAVKGLGSVLVSFRYRLDDEGDSLKVAFEADGRRVDHVYPYFNEPRTVTMAFRPRRPTTVSLTLSAAQGASLDRGGIRTLDLADWRNVAYFAADRSGDNTPRLMIPNIQGALGDPREEQIAYVYPSKAGHLLTPDLRDQENRIDLCFDGDIHTAAALYPTVYPAGHAGWYPSESRSTLRSAQLIMEYGKPVSVAAIGIWEHAYDHPVKAFALEYCDDAHEGFMKTLEGSWQLALTVFDNTDYYHLHAFPEPITARFWRYTILATDARVQSVAEVELYQNTLEGLMELEF